MALLIDHQAINVPAGSRSFETARVAGLVGRLMVRVGRCTAATPTLWPLESTVLDFDLYTSADAGATWQHRTGFHAEGGILPYTAGTGPGPGDLVESTAGCEIPADVNRIRVDVTVSARLISVLTVEVS